MERDDIERIADRVAQSAVALARAEMMLDLSNFRESMRGDVQTHLTAMQDLLQRKLDGGIAGMSLEAHTVEHMRMREFLDSASDMKRDFTKQLISIIAAGAVAFLLTFYFSREGAVPVPTVKDLSFYLTDKSHGVKIV